MPLCSPLASSDSRLTPGRHDCEFPAQLHPLLCPPPWGLTDLLRPQGPQELAPAWGPAYLSTPPLPTRRDSSRPTHCLAEGASVTPTTPRLSTKCQRLPGSTLSPHRPRAVCFPLVAGSPRMTVLNTKPVSRGHSTDVQTGEGRRRRAGPVPPPRAQRVLGLQVMPLLPPATLARPLPDYSIYRAMMRQDETSPSGQMEQR